MSDYRITSADFVTPGESLVPDAFISAEDLANIKKQSDLKEFLHKQIAQRLAQPDVSKGAYTIELREQNDN